MEKIIFILIGIVISIVVFVIYKLITIQKDMENDAKKIEEKEKEIDAENAYGTKIANEVLNKYKSFRFNYCNKTNDGEICYVFTNDIYIVCLWLHNNVSVEVSIHKNDKCLFNKVNNEKVNEKLVIAFFSIISNFLAEIRFNADAEDVTYKQGQLQGFRSGYISGYLRGNKDGLGGKFNIPEDDKDKIKDIMLIAEEK